jgi:hypothetical protein
MNSWWTMFMQTTRLLAQAFTLFQRWTAQQQHQLMNRSPFMIRYPAQGVLFFQAKEKPG